MRDLQQAFVHDHQSNPVANMEDLNRLNFDPKKKAVNDANLLDLLKAEDQDQTDSGHGTDPERPSPSQSVEQKRASKVMTATASNVRQQPQKYLVSDSSSCGGYESAESEKDIVVLAAEHIQALDIQQDRHHPDQVQHENNKKPKKKSFWQKLLRSSSNNHS